jgi:hypothetical protein
MSEPHTPDPTTAWLQVVAILTTAADTPPTTGPVDPELHSLALGAQIVASRALALLPANADSDVENLTLETVAVDNVARGADAPSTVRDLIRAAGQIARRHGAEVFPAGAAAVITELEDLLAEAEARP